MENYNRDHIKRRMLRRVSTLWDIEDMDNVDPIIGLLIEAMSEEMFRLAGEVGNMDDRMLAKALGIALSRGVCHPASLSCTDESLYIRGYPAHRAGNGLFIPRIKDGQTAWS